MTIPDAGRVPLPSGDSDTMSNYTRKMTIRPDALADWDAGLANNTDAYRRRCFTYADDWAAMMEAEIGNDDPLVAVPRCADRTSHAADTDGITGFMYGMAVSILARVWIHGDVLRRWHNKKIQIGTEGDEANQSGATLNPALLSIG